MRYNKLVRDRIPEIIRAAGGTPVTETLGDSGYDGALREKIAEEAGEVRVASGRDALLGELADVIEVAYALATHHGISRDEIEEARVRKHAERGGFEARTFLLSDGAGS